MTANSQGKTLGLFGIYSRVLAAGTWSRHKGDSSLDREDIKLRLTLLLTPAPDNGTSFAAPFGIQSWPSKVAEAFDRFPKSYDGKDSYAVPIRIQLFQPNCVDKPRPWDGKLDTVVVKARAKRFYFAFGDDEGKADRRSVDDLWSKTFTHDCADGWSDLKTGLEASFKGSAYKPGAIAKQGATGENGIINDVRSVRQSDLAVALELTRAREIIATVQEAFGDTTARRRLEDELRNDEPDTGAPDPSASNSQGTDTDTVLKDDEAADLVKAAAKADHAAVVDRLRRSNLKTTIAAKAYEDALANHNSDACYPPKPLKWTSASTSWATDKARDLHKKADVPLASHADGTWLEQNAGGDAPGATHPAEAHVPTEGEEKTSRRFFALQSAPSLARLFGLAVDLELEMNDVLAEMERQGLPTDLILSENKGERGSVYFFLSTMFGREGDQADSFAPGPPLKDKVYPVAWTLAELDARPEAVAFWPAARLEIDSSEKENSTRDEALSQSNGLMLLGHGWANHKPRFEITSLDVRTASERQEQRNRERRLLPDSAGVTEEAAASYEEMVERPIQRQTMMTSGLVLLDRGREAATAAKLALRVAQQDQASTSGIVLLDADELAIGYRPDVGVRVPAKDGNGKPHYEWRGLMNREVVFGDSGLQGNLVIKLLDCLTGERGEESRTMLDSASVATPMRLMPMSEVVVENGKQTVKTKGTATVVEEIFTLWEGGPMGADCSGDASLKTVAEDLPIGRRITLPDSMDDHRLLPPRLRFGWPYRVGMRAVYMGGASPSVLEASESYRTYPNGYLNFPPGPQEGGNQELRRILRHERIDAPILLLPGDLATEELGEMGFEKSTAAIVRRVYAHGQVIGDGPPAEAGMDEADGDARARAKPSTTRRIFVPPNVPQAFAGLHGVFDDDVVDKPAQGLQYVRYDAQGGGFPFAVATEHRGFDGIVFATSRAISTTKSEHGDGVFATSRTPEQLVRPAPYYPDPVAHHYVVALRHANTRAYLPGQPRTVPIYSSKRGYPNVAPLQVKVVALANKRPRGEVSQREIIQEARPVKLDPTKSGRAIDAMEVEIWLHPGEDFELDVWCAPDVTTLARVFAPVETLGVLAAGGISATEVDSTATLDVGALRALFESKAPGTDTSATIPQAAADAAQIELNKVSKPGYVGVASMKTPGASGLRAVATILYGALTTRPIDELGAVRSLRVTHAVNRPAYYPAFADTVKTWNNWPLEAPNLLSLKVARPQKQAAARLRAMPSGERYGKFFDRPLVEAGSNDFALGGTVAIDLETSDAFEIEAVTAFPRSAKFDDSQKRRAQKDRRSGKWPSAVDADDHKYKLLSTSDIYGFHVSPDGVVELPRAAVTLLRVENLKAPRVSGMTEHLGMRELLQLEEFYGLERADRGRYPLESTALGGSDPGSGAAPVVADPDPRSPPPRAKGAKVSLPHVFPDGKARELEVSIVALSRFAHDWYTAARRDKNKVFQYGRPLPRLAEITRSDPVKLWLPATFRPSKVVSRTPLPVFKWDLHSYPSEGRYTLTRTAHIRVPLSREWFSSGEGERLGIVLWPPDLFNKDAKGDYTQAPSDLENNVVDLPNFPGKVSEASKEDTRPIVLEDFQDSDLGPGGAFVTRWGGDPIRGRSAYVDKNGNVVDFEQGGLFMPQHAFADFGKEDVCLLVPSVAMPIGAAEPQNGPMQPGQLDSTQKDEDAEAAAETLLVSLLAYEPRFDVAREEWYVDLEIVPEKATDPFVRLGLVRYQEHAPPHLRVSQPVVEWTQVLPKRDVVVNVAELDGRLTIVATVTGQATVGVKPEPWDRSQGDPVLLRAPEIAHARPTMHFRLVAQGEDPSGRETQFVVGDNQVRIVDEDNGGPNSAAKDAVTPANGATTWTTTFEVTEQDRLALGNVRFFVFMDEIEYRHPATYPDEPLELPVGVPDTTFVASGPRFSARIDLDGVAVLTQQVPVPAY